MPAGRNLVMRVGFIGLGIMGASMASNLQAAGHALAVHDVRRAAAAPHLAAGAVWKDSPRALAADVDVVFTSLPAPPEVEQVAVGAGAVAKLVHNGACFTIRTGLAEVFSMGVRAGVAPELLWQAVRQGATGRRRTFDVLVDKFLPGEFEPPSFALRLGHKDVSLATALGREHGVPMRLANLALEEITEALNRGWGDRHSRSVMLLEEERAAAHIPEPRD